jgi:hypothetical protein
MTGAPEPLRIAHEVGLVEDDETAANPQEP